jgi:ribosomal protein S18 acetylase RimI-like enzyme
MTIPFDARNGNAWCGRLAASQDRRENPVAMARIASVDPTQLHSAFLEAFADYAMSASRTTEEQLFLRMEKNAVDYDVSPGLYDGDRLVGFTLIGIDTWGDRLTAYDAGTGILPEFRKQGWARKMFEYALPALRTRDVGRFALEVLQQNEPAIKAYRKSGFEIARELKCYVGQAADLREPNPPSTLEIRPIARSVLADLEPSADWLPSFENRFSAVDAISGHVRLTGAFEGGICVGAAAYAPRLNWLLTLVVDREHRRRGVGTALIRHLANTLPESAARLTALNVDGDAAGTQAFFTSLGFTYLADQYEMVREIG